MPSQYTIEKILGTFKECYQTIDLRVALLKYEDRWQSRCMALRIRVDPIDIVKKEFEDLENTHNKIGSSKFYIFQACSPICEFNNIVEHLNKGILSFKENDIHLDKTMITGILEAHGFIHEPLVITASPWPTLDTNAVFTNSSDIPSHQLLRDDEILRDVEVAGYRNPSLAIKELLKVESFAEGTSDTFYIICEIPALINSYSIKVGRNSTGTINMTIPIIAHQSLSDLSCDMQRKETNTDRVLEHGNIPLRSQGVKDNLQKWSAYIEFKYPVGTYDRANIGLVHGMLGLVYSENINLIPSLPIEERNPLFKTLLLFCPVDEIRNLLDSPQKFNGNRKYDINLKNDGKLYEVSIQWLLSSLGLRAVWLHGYEKLKENNHEIGTVDCLAYYEARHSLLLIHCTTGPPDQNEIARYKHVQQYIEDKIFENTEVSLYSVLFTSTSGADAIKISTVHNLSPIKIFYRENISELLDLIEKGRESAFISMVSMPFP